MVHYGGASSHKFLLDSALADFLLPLQSLKKLMGPCSSIPQKGSIIHNLGEKEKNKREGETEMAREVKK
jgi:hypothetical protein